MQQIKGFLFGLFLCMIFLPCVSAECSNKERAELNSLAANVKANYEEAQRELNEEDYTIPDAIYDKETAKDYVAYEDYFKINILNVMDKIYVEVNNNYDSNRYTFNSQNVKEGVATFDWDNLDKVTTFTIKVYADNTTSCEGDALRTMYVTTPRYNQYHMYDVCEKAKELDVCQKYVTSKNIDYAVFMRKVDEYLNDGMNGSGEKDKSFFKQNKRAIIIGGVALLIIVGVGVAVIVQRKRSSEI